MLYCQVYLQDSFMSWMPAKTLLQWCNVCVMHIYASGQSTKAVEQKVWLQAQKLTLSISAMLDDYQHKHGYFFVTVALVLKKIIHDDQHQLS